jgi:hypothetical protein
MKPEIAENNAAPRENGNILNENTGERQPRLPADNDPLALHLIL